MPTVSIRPRRIASLPTHIQYVHLPLETKDSALITIARTEKERAAAYTQLSLAAHNWVVFDNFHQKTARINEERMRNNLYRELEQLGPRTSGLAQARWIVRHFDAGCASPGEAQILYLLHRAELTPVISQYEVLSHEHRYFLDAASPSYKVGIEFDGRTKYGETAELVHSSLDRERARQRHLESEGWHIIRVRWRDLSYSSEIVEQIRSALRARGALL